MVERFIFDHCLDSSNDRINTGDWLGGGASYHVHGGFELGWRDEALEGHIRVDLQSLPRVTVFEEKFSGSDEDTMPVSRLEADSHDMVKGFGGTGTLTVKDKTLKRGQKFRNGASVHWLFEPLRGRLGWCNILRGFLDANTESGQSLGANGLQKPHILRQSMGCPCLWL